MAKHIHIHVGKTQDQSRESWGQMASYMNEIKRQVFQGEKAIRTENWAITQESAKAIERLARMIQSGK